MIVFVETFIVHNCGSHKPPLTILPQLIGIKAFTLPFLNLSLFNVYFLGENYALGWDMSELLFRIFQWAVTLVPRPSPSSNYMRGKSGEGAWLHQ